MIYSLHNVYNVSQHRNSDHINTLATVIAKHIQCLSVLF